MLRGIVDSNKHLRRLKVSRCCCNIPSGPIELRVNNRCWGVARIGTAIGVRILPFCFWEAVVIYSTCGQSWTDSNTVATAHLQEVRFLANLPPCVDCTLLSPYRWVISLHNMSRNQHIYIVSLKSSIILYK